MRKVILTKHQICVSTEELRGSIHLRVSACNAVLDDGGALRLADDLSRGRLSALVRQVRKAQKRIEARCDDPRDDDLVRDLDTAVLAFRGEFEP